MTVPFTSMQADLDAPRIGELPSWVVDRSIQTKVLAIGADRELVGPGIERVRPGPDALDRALDPNLLAVVLSEDVPTPTAARIVRTVKAEARSLFVVVEGAPRRWTELPDADAVLPPYDGTVLVEELLALVGASAYGPATRRSVAAAAESCLDALCGGFCPKQAFVRTTDLLPGDFHAMIPWTGSDGSGWLTVSISVDALARTMGGSFCGHDATNELANQMLGCFKRTVAQHEVHLDNGLPLSFVGRRPPFSHRRPPSSLMVEMHDGAHSVWVDIAAGPLEPLLARPVTSSDELRTGEIVLL